MELFIVSGELVRLRVSQAKMAASEYLTLVCVTLRERERETESASTFCHILENTGNTGATVYSYYITPSIITSLNINITKGMSFNIYF